MQAKKTFISSRAVEPQSLGLKGVSIFNLSTGIMESVIETEMDYPHWERKPYSEVNLVVYELYAIQAFIVKLAQKCKSYIYAIYGIRVSTA